MNQDTPTLTTVKNGKTQEWITIIEDGIPVWVVKNSCQKHTFLEKLDTLLQEASQEDDDEPVIEIQCQSGQIFQVHYFPFASLYLCEELEGRYSTLSTLADALWELLKNQTITNYRLL